ncbi:MAG: ester cyclase [Acidobacteriaceae bacterium]|nr:ester cyclase [Acidobacteriaceae bacterium]MBV9779974.1 ester cyclase [Acidobacteriaceae bacterium]
MAANTQGITDLQLELWNTGNSEIAKQLYSEHAERSDPNGREPIRHRGVHQIASFVAEVRTAFPDFKLHLKESVAEGDHVAFHWTVTGTQKGEFQGIPASGRHIEFSGMSLDRLRDGKVVSEHVYFDRLALLEQLGAAPANAAAGGAS